MTTARPARPRSALSTVAAAVVAVVLVTAAAATGIDDDGPGDPIRDARCFAKCHHRRPSSEQPKCYSGCLQNERWTKPGECPVGDLDGSGVASLDRPCLEQCSSDDFCRAEYKCCRHSCGITCQPPVRLADSPGLPDEPNVVAVSDYGKTLTVEWSASSSSSPGHVTYVLQERHHAGSVYVPERMTAWSTAARTDRTREPLKQPPYALGRWFQFRVAAVNENGTRGFSAPSRPFFTELGSQVDVPSPPQNLMLSQPEWTDSGKYQQCVLSWTPPAVSVLPVRKYKLFVIVRDGSHVYYKRHDVPADILRFLIKKLNPNSEYFLQVQAISEFGRKRFAGKKASITLKTKGYKILSTKKITGIKVVSVKYGDGGGYKTDLIHARISWRPVNMSAKKFLYTVSWTPENCEDKSKKLRAKVRMPFFDLFSLNPRCKYSIVISTTYNGSRYVGSFIFTSPLMAL